MLDIYIRPLQVADAQISFQWRNDPEVWKYTGSRPDRTITPEIEEEWIKNVLQRDHEKRFAICVTGTDQYIGNVQLTHINGYNAEFHIFIGDKTFWGKKAGTGATKQILDFAFNTMQLQSVFLDVKKENIAAIKAYEKAGFRKISETPAYLRMAIYAIDREPAAISIFMMTYNHEPFIRQALDGILAQQCSYSYEIVVGDDFSKDNTRSILLEYAIKHPGLFKLLFHGENIGAAKNQDAILRAMNGRYIAMCEGDDYWTSPHKLQAQAGFLEQHPGYNFVFHKAQLLHIETGAFSDCTLNDRTADTTTIDDLLKGNYIRTCTAFFRAEGLAFIKKPELAGWLEKALPGDWLIFIAAVNSGKIKFIPECMAVYRIHDAGTWSTIQDRQLKYAEPLYNGFVFLKTLLPADQFDAIFYQYTHAMGILALKKKSEKNYAAYFALKRKLYFTLLRYKARKLTKN